MISIFKNLDKKDAAAILLCLLLVCGQVFFDLKMPEYMQEITVLVQTPGNTMESVLIAGGMMLLCTLGTLVLTIIGGFFTARVAAGFCRKLRGLVFKKTLSFSMEEINGFSTASLITRSTNDITQIQLIMAMGLQITMRAPITVIWALGKISTKHWQFSLATAGATLFLVLIIVAVQALAVPRFKRIQALTDNINRVARENLTGLRVVKAYNADAYQERKFGEANDALTSNNLFAHRVMALLHAGMGFAIPSMSLAIYWIGSFLINASGVMNRLTIFSEMVTFMAYSMQVVMSLMLLSMMFVMLPRVMVSANRVCEVIYTEEKITDGHGAQPEESRKGEVEMRGVSFRYPDGGEYVLRDVSFKALPGETVAFIGATGSGKSTLMNLIPRFYDVSEGEVLVDGIDVREYTQEQLHNRLGYVPQRATIFSGDVSSNVAFGANGAPEPDEEAIKRAVRIAQAEEFVSKMEGGCAAHVARGGENLSGGQKQRLSIARAVCRAPEIYIFDDSFSALDYKTDRNLRSALASETGDATRLIVAQRIGTIKDADKIIVLDEGRVVGMGRHEELLKNCEVYLEIAQSQLSKEELGA